MKVMVIVKANADTEAGVMPAEQELTAMGHFNEELVKAGIMLAGEGLHPTRKGVRVRCSGTQRSVQDGPFAETKELIAGYTLIEARSRDEALEWSRRFPNPNGAGVPAEIEVRPLYGLEDFAPSPAIERFKALDLPS